MKEQPIVPPSPLNFLCGLVSFSPFFSPRLQPSLPPPPLACVLISTEGTYLTSSPSFILPPPGSPPCLPGATLFLS